MSLPSTTWRPRPLAEATRPATHLPGARDAHRGSATRSPPAWPASSGRWSRSDGQAGLALTLQDGVYESQLPGRIHGAETRWLAEHITSWNMFDASLALAAVNAWFNRRDRVERLLGGRSSASAASPLRACRERFAGGSVAVVGHFPHLEPLGERCTLTILERRPSGGDLPDQACEYLLGRQDCVCITGSAVTNKTLPRLLELSRDAYVVLVGPASTHRHVVRLRRRPPRGDGRSRPRRRPRASSRAPPLALRGQPRHGRVERAVAGRS